MARFRKILLYFLLAMGAFFIALLSSVFLYQDKIINQFIREVNKSLNTPVDIKKISVSWLADFPNLSIVFKDVYIEDSHPETYPLLTAETISFQLNVYDLWNGKYTIKGLQISNSEANLKINATGVNNYTILKPTDKKNQSESISFALKNVKLNNTKFQYRDLSAEQHYTFLSESLIASISTEKDIYTILADGDVTTEKLKVRNIEVFTGKKFIIASDLIYDDLNKSLAINPSSLTLRNSTFSVSGQYNWKDKQEVDLNINAKDTDIQTLISLFPDNTANSFEKYRSKGDMYFNGKLKGEISKDTSPALSIDFGFENTTIYHPDYQSEIKSASMQGSFASSHISNPADAVLILKNIEGQLNNKNFSANLSIHNFENSDVALDFKGAIDARAVYEFYPIKKIRAVKGELLANIHFNGKLSWLKQKATTRQASTKGIVQIKNLSFLYGDESLPLKDLNGTLQFDNNDLALSDIHATLGDSDFLVNGFFKNIITFILFENQPIGIEADLKSNFLDLNQLFQLGFGKTESKKSSGEYEFNISRNINLNFNCHIKSLRYKRFNAKDAIGDLLVKNQMAVSRNITLKSMGGKMKFSGIVDAKNAKAIDVVSTFRLDGIHVDSVFYVFENFDQTFIQNKHLQGQAYADVNLEMTLKPNLRLFSETLVADIGLIIKNGELNNFEPIQRLDKYLDDKSLHHVRFSDLKNEIQIKNKTIYLPQMDVSTNLTSIRIRGTHTFDQLIDYRIITPLRNPKNITSQEARNAVEDLGEGKSKLYLKIVGTTDNYRVAYDTDAVGKKIGTDIKEEIKELRETFKNKGKQKEKELELQEDEYFDWDDDDQSN